MEGGREGEGEGGREGEEEGEGEGALETVRRHLPKTRGQFIMLSCAKGQAASLLHVPCSVHIYPSRLLTLK